VKLRGTLFLEKDDLLPEGESSGASQISSKARSDVDLDLATVNIVIRGTTLCKSFQLVPLFQTSLRLAFAPRCGICGWSKVFQIIGFVLDPLGVALKFHRAISDMPKVKKKKRDKNFRKSEKK
jgi:hypothetical protein